MSKSHLARLVLLEIEAVKTGDYEGKVVNLLTMVNEVMRTASGLAEKTLADGEYVDIPREDSDVLKQKLVNAVKNSKDLKRFL